MQATYKDLSPVHGTFEADSGLSEIDRLNTEEDTDPNFRAAQKAPSKWFDSNPSAKAPNVYQPKWREHMALGRNVQMIHHVLRG
ncbi:hypothetical protein BHYA_0157g00120 [Botrytis hyacinthi]|uniref:Uncharacterized protein n=1 Tax=Botrytis hyacinthi TaxID=278943 RepID=A0A4Z1GJ42_9HELO|nr:hypothetical protein BHYA_0157g00120 [Botrytis hyacinthi]